MLRTTLAVALTLASTQVLAECPDYMNHEMRKLHSGESTSLCAVGEGKPMLIVNTASHCGYTRQFKGLEAVYQQYREQGLEVVGFASDSFRQEADSEEKAAEICYKNFGVTFTMFAPSAVRGGEANPVFEELGRQTSEPKWNFNKYLVDRDGNVVQQFGSSTEPQGQALTAAIEGVL